MDNWFPIGKRVDFNLIYLPVGRVRWPVNQPFQYLLWLKTQGLEFLSQVHDAGIKSIFEQTRNAIWSAHRCSLPAPGFEMVLK